MSGSASRPSGVSDARRRTQTFHGIYEAMLKSGPSGRAAGFACHLRTAMQTGINALACAEMIGLIVAGLRDIPAEHEGRPVPASSLVKTVARGLVSTPYRSGNSREARRRIDELVIEARTRIDEAAEPFDEPARMFSRLLAAGAYPPPAAGVLGAMIWARGTDISPAHEDCRRQLDEEAARIQSEIADERRPATGPTGARARWPGEAARPDTAKDRHVKTEVNK